MQCNCSGTNTGLGKKAQEPALISFVSMGSTGMKDSFEWIDVTVPVSAETPVWPGDPSPVLTAIARHEDGDEAHLSELFFGLHSGTHIDAPLHFIPGGGDVCTLPLDALIGVVRVLDATDCVVISAEWLRKRLGDEQRVIFKTSSDEADRRTLLEAPDFPALDVSAAAMLVEKGVMLAGIDGLSIAIQSELAPVHRLLLEKDVVVLEHLDLRRIKEGIYEMIALPMRITGAEAAPTRVLIRPVPQI